MKSDNTLFLKLSYGYLLVLLVFTALFLAQAVIRYLLLFTAFAFVAAAHMLLAIKTRALATNRLFFLISTLWFVKFISFAVSEGLYIFTGEGLIAFAWFDLFFLLFLAIVAAISFILQVPFFYVRTEEKSWIIVGIVCVIFSAWILLQISYSFVDFVHHPR